MKKLSHIMLIQSEIICERVREREREREQHSDNNDKLKDLQNKIPQLGKYNLGEIMLGIDHE